MPTNPQGTRPLITAGPFVGVSDTIPLSSQDVNRCASLTNGFIRLPELGGDVQARPGFTQQTVASVTVPAGYGAVQAPIYALASMIGTDGTAYNLAIVSIASAPAAGEFFITPSPANPAILVRWNPGAGTYTFAMAGGTGGQVLTFTITGVTRFWFCPFAGYLIFSNQIEGLRKWNPANIGLASGTATFSDVGGTADVVYGPPTVWMGKLFYIKNADRQTFCWSNENDPDTGYTGTNSWTFRQTSSDRLTRLMGTNEALYVFRENGVTTVQANGANADFKSASTLNSISDTVGTKSPGSVCLFNNQVWFLDQYARPYKIEPGRGLVPLWPRCRETIKDADTSDAQLYQAWGQYIPTLDVVVFGYRASSGATGAVQLLVFCARTEEFLGTWTIAANVDMRYGVGFRDENGQYTLAVTEYGVSSLSFDTQKQDTATTVASDTLASTTAVPFTLETPRLYGDIETQKRFNRVALTSQRVSPDSVMATLGGQYRGSNSGTYTASENLRKTTPDSGMPGRETAAVNLQVSRWFQAKFTNDTSVTARTTIGQVLVYGTETQAAWDAM